MPRGDAGLNVVITGDVSGLQRATRDAGRSLDKLGKETTLHARITSRGFSGIAVAARGMAAGFGAAVVGGGYLVKQFEESNKVAKQTEAVLKSTGGAANVTAKQVTDLATAISRKTGIDDEAVQSGENLLLTFTRVRNEAGKGNQIFTQATRVITDMSVALGQDMKSSAIQVGKALNDPIKGITALQRVGVSFTAQQRDQIKTLEQTGHHLAAQKIILHELNREFGGSAAAQATPFDKLKVSAGNLAETLGGYLAPAVGKAANWLNRFLIQLQDGTGAGGKFIHWVKNAADTLKGAWQTAVAAVNRFIARNRDDIDALGKAMHNLGVAIQAVVVNVMIPIAKRMLSIYKGVFEGIVEAIGGLIKIVSGVLTGDWKRAWGGVVDVVKGAAHVVVSVWGGIASGLWNATKAAGKAIVKGIVAGMSGLASALKNAVVSAVKSVPGLLGDAAKGIGSALISPITSRFHDGIGKAISGPVLGTPGLGGGMLMGADPDLAPFASLAASMGLHTSSGLRPGAVTLSGLPSYHASGDAIDEAGPTGAMYRYASTMYHRFGGRLRELISPWPQFGIKDGRPFRYSGAIEAQHSGANAHVHVAYTGPFGDGIGQIENLWVRAGGSRRAAAMAAAIAMAESSGRPGVTHRNADGSIDRGLWQINSVHGGLSTTDRLGNARAAVRISGNGRNWSPWTTYTSGAYRAFLGAAQAAARGLSGAGGSSGGSSGGGGSSSGPNLSSGGSVLGSGNTAAGIGSTIQGGPNEPLLGPGQGGYSQQVANAEMGQAEARARNRLAPLIKALQTELKIKQRRLSRVRRMLRHHLRKDTRQRLTEEATSLLGDIADLKSTLKEYRADFAGGARTITRAEELDAGVDPNAASADTGTTDVGSVDAGPVDTGPTVQQQVDQQLADAVNALAAEQKAIRLLMQTQGPQLHAALLAFVSGGIGGNVGLGLQTPGYAGSGVRY